MVDGIHAAAELPQELVMVRPTGTAGVFDITGLFLEPYSVVSFVTVSLARHCEGRDAALIGGRSEM